MIGSLSFPPHEEVKERVSNQGRVTVREPCHDLLPCLERGGQSVVSPADRLSEGALRISAPVQLLPGHREVKKLRMQYGERLGLRLLSIRGQARQRCETVEFSV